MSTQELSSERNDEIFIWGIPVFGFHIYIYTYIHIYTVYINIYIYVYIYMYIYIYNNMYIIYAPFLNHRTHNSFRWVLTDTLAWTGPQSDRNRMRAGKAGHKMIVFFSMFRWILHVSFFVLRPYLTWFVQSRKRRMRRSEVYLLKIWKALILKIIWSIQVYHLWLVVSHTLIFLIIEIGWSCAMTRIFWLDINCKTKLLDNNWMIMNDNFKIMPYSFLSIILW
jgi:hypothetical protein